MASDVPFIRSILHTTDFSQASNRAFAHALAIALLRQTELTILHVSDNDGDDVPWSEFPEVRKTLERWSLLEPNSPRSAVADRFSVAVSKVAARGTRPVGATLRFLEGRPHDLVVLATEGNGQDSSDWLFSSSAEGIRRGSGAMTLFVPARSEREMVSFETGDLNVKHILVPVDPNIDAGPAIEFARRSADVMGDGDVVITLLHVGDRLPRMPDAEQNPRWTFRTELRNGDVPAAILAAAAEHRSDLIVMTTNGRDTLGQAVVDQTADRDHQRERQNRRQAPGQHGAAPYDQSPDTDHQA